jgi:N,N'-diacetyl-8-epilegionaminate cytidylyltransferase
MSGEIIGLVCARGGSKGIPRKNLRLLGGRPLIAYAIEVGRQSKLLSRVIVSTDDPEIAEIARAEGAEVPFMRPAELARDNSPEWPVWQHAIRSLQAAGTDLRALVVIPATSPLRSVADVDACARLLLESDADVVITVRQADRSPYFNMVTIDPNGLANLVIRPEGRPVTRRQDAPVVFDITTVAYAARPEHVLNSTGNFQGKVRAVEVPRERALDIDSDFDWAIAEFLMEERTCEQ